MNLLTKKKQAHKYKLSRCSSEGVEGLGFGVSRCKLLHLEWLSREGQDKDGRGIRRGTHLLLQTHKKKISMWNDLHRTSTECWQKTLDSQKEHENAT